MNSLCVISINYRNARAVTCINRCNHNYIMQFVDCNATLSKSLLNKLMKCKKNQRNKKKRVKISESGRKLKTNTSGI